MGPLPPWWLLHLEMEITMPTIQSGSDFWPNLDVLIYDAKRTKFLKEENERLRWLIGAIANKGEVRVPQKAIDAHLPYQSGWDMQTNEYVIWGDK
jgi:hypothetical protein